MRTRLETGNELSLDISRHAFSVTNLSPESAVVANCYIAKILGKAFTIAGFYQCLSYCRWFFLYSETCQQLLVPLKATQFIQVDNLWKLTDPKICLCQYDAHTLSA
jgi:hypothetical protein